MVSIGGLLKGSWGVLVALLGQGDVWSDGVLPRLRLVCPVGPKSRRTPTLNPTQGPCSVIYVYHYFYIPYVYTHACVYMYMGILIYVYNVNIRG